jgi:hypothetical protein
MRKITAILLFTTLPFACKYDTQKSKDELKAKLMKTMNDFLYKTVNYDSSTVKYHVLDVIYFEAPAMYDCVFTVHMKERNLDTTGTMEARITKDMAKVVRRS